LNGEINELKLFKFIKIYPYQQPFDHFLGLNDLHFNLDLKKNLPFFYNILPFFCFLVFPLYQIEPDRFGIMQFLSQPRRVSPVVPRPLGIDY
jgi:hypothetical protein